VPPGLACRRCNVLMWDEPDRAGGCAGVDLEAQAHTLSTEAFSPIRLLAESLRASSLLPGCAEGCCMHLKKETEGSSYLRAWRSGFNTSGPERVLPDRGSQEWRCSPEIREEVARPRRPRLPRLRGPSQTRITGKAVPRVPAPSDSDGPWDAGKRQRLFWS